MKKLYLRFFAAALFFVSSIFNIKAQICNPSGNLVIFTNYDGGNLTIDVDANIPNLKIGICSYESVRVNIIGTYTANVTQVIYAGFNGSNMHCPGSPTVSSVSGVPAGIVSINFAPPVGYSNPNGNSSMICGYSCSTSSSQGGCNTVDQIAYYFMQQTGGTLHSHTVQYGCWTAGAKTISGGGNCCALPCTVPAAPTNTTTAAQQVICSGRTTTLSATSTGTVNWYATSTSTMALGTGTNYVTPTLSTAGTYTYYAQTTTTCGVSASRTPVTVTVNPTPTVAVNSGSVCSGKSFTMTPTGAITYTFSGGSAVVSPTLTALPSVVATYTVTGANAQGCTNTAVSSLTVYALPGVSVTPASANACVNSGSIALTGSPAGGAYSGTNVSGSNFTPATTGTFTPMYSYTASTGCTNTASTSIVVSSCTGIGTISQTKPTVSIQPNPNSGEFLVEFANGAEKQISVRDITGKLVYIGNSSQDKTMINIASLANGIYYVQIQSGKTNETIKIVKQ